MRELVLGASLYASYTTNRVYSQTKNSRELSIFKKCASSIFKKCARKLARVLRFMVVFHFFASLTASFQSGKKCKKQSATFYASFAEKCVSFGKLAQVLTKSEGVSVPLFNDFLKKARVLKTEKSRSKLAHFSEILTASFCTGLSFLREFLSLFTRVFGEVCQVFCLFVI